MKISPTKEPADHLDVDLLAMGIFEDSGPLTRGSIGVVDWRLNGFLSKMILNRRFSCQWGETALIPTHQRLNAHQVILFGLGQSKDFTPNLLVKFLKEIIDKSSRIKAGSIGLTCENFDIPGDRIIKELKQIKSSKQGPQIIYLIQPEGIKQ